MMIAENYCFTNELTAAERVALDRYLAVKWDEKGFAAITITVANAKALRGIRAKIVDFETVVGTLDGWTVETDYDADVSVTLETDGIYATSRRYGDKGLSR